MPSQRLPAKLLALVLSSVIGFAAGQLYHWHAEHDFIDELQLKARREANSLEEQTLSGMGMGALVLAGRLNPEIQATAAEIDPDIAKKHERTTKALEIVASSAQAGHAFVVNREGLITGDWGKEGKSSVGINIKFRSYFQQALQGQNSVYAGISAASGRRAVYIAAPVYNEPGNRGKITGVIAARYEGEILDDFLSERKHTGLLISPEGLIYASDRREWVFNLLGTVSPQRLQTITETKRFGKMSADDLRIKSFPVDLSKPTSSFNDKVYAVAKAPINWNDPQGEWTLCLLGDTSHTLSDSMELIISLIVGGLIFTLCLSSLRMVAYNRARSLALAENQRVSAALAAEARSRNLIVELSGQLPLAQDLHGLAGIFFRHVTDFLPIHQASLYVCDEAAPENKLLLAGSYGAKTIPSEVLFGEGLLGQCAVEKKMLYFNNPPSDFWQISSGLGKSPAHSLLLCPLLQQEQIIGIVEFASLEPLHDTDLAAVNRLVQVLSLHLLILRRNLAMAALVKQISARQPDPETAAGISAVGA